MRWGYPSCGAVFFNCFLGYGQGLFDTNTQGGAAKIIADDPDRRIFTLHLGQPIHMFSVAEVVLRYGALPDLNMPKRWRL